MNQREIERIVLLSEQDYQRELVPLVESEKAAYERYCGGVRGPRAGHGTPRVEGTPWAIGHASWVCQLNRDGVQDAWVAARRREREFRDARTSWTLQTVAGGLAIYQQTYHSGRVVEIVTHGVDVSACPTPSAAIQVIRDGVAA